MSLQRISKRSLLCGLAALTAAGSARADDCTLDVEIVPGAWSQLQGWAQALTPRLGSWWTTINHGLGVTACERRGIKLVLAVVKPDSVAAAARGDRIIVNAPYVLANLGNADMDRMIAHELVHVAQAYPEGTPPIWLVEGIADYLRYYVLFPTDPGRFFDPDKESWHEGYSPSAGLIDWAETRRPGTLAAINTAMHAGDDGGAAFALAAGLTPAAAWRAYLKTRPAAASADRRQAYWASLKHAG